MSATIWVLWGAFCMAIAAGMLWTAYGLRDARVSLAGVGFVLLGVVGLLLVDYVSPIAGLALAIAALAVAGLRYREIRQLIVHTNGQEHR